MALKSEHINDAYSQLRISGITVIPSSELQGKALERLENMMARYSFDIGYNFEETPDLNTPSGVERRHHHMIATNLAVALIPDFNKAVPVTLEKQASGAYSATCAFVAARDIQQVQPSSRMPRGSGNHYRYNQWQKFNPEPVVLVDVNQLYVDDVNDYQESFTGYLAGETIASYTITVTDALTLGTNSNTDDVVSYRITGASKGTGTVTIVITTSSGRVQTRVIQFEVL